MKICLSKMRVRSELLLILEVMWHIRIREVEIYSNLTFLDKLVSPFEQVSQPLDRAGQ